MSTMNRLANVNNHYQGDYKRVLAICSAGLLRSPTIAWVLSQEPYNYNTRSAGIISEYALIPVDDVLLEWSELIICAENSHETILRSKFDIGKKPVLSFQIADMYPFKNKELIQMIKEAADELIVN